MNAMREANTREVEEYRSIEHLFQGWVEEGLWEHLEHAIPDVKFYGDYDPLVHVYRVTKEGQ